MATVTVKPEFVELASSKDGKISAGEQFQVNVKFTPDTANTAIISGYVDLLFDQNNFTVNEIIYDPDFDYVYDATLPASLKYSPARNSGQTPVQGSGNGELNEVGAYHESSPGPNDNPPTVPVPAPDGDLVFSIKLTAKNTLSGTQTTITSNKADTSNKAEENTNKIVTQGTQAGQDPQGNSITVLSQTQAQEATNVNYGSLDIPIASANPPQPTVPTITIAATDAQASEPGTDTGEFTITRTGDTTAPLTVKYTIGGKAINKTDYNEIGDFVTIAAGAASATINVIPIDDSLVEGNETVILTLQDEANYDLGTSKSATVTIADNDQAPPPVSTVTITATDAQASETGPDAGQFTITRTGDTAASLTVQYTIDGTATNNSDYNQIPTSITIAAGAESATIDITPIDDGLVDGNETVLLTLVDGTSYNLGTTTSATVTIADNHDSCY
jgi:hypothetical protein